MVEEKLKFAFYWAASCGGCEVAVLDVNEKILDIVAVADIVFWPVALDTKYKEVKAMADKSIDVCFFNGAIRNSENESMAKLLRKKSKTLIAFGSCAHIGGIPGLANLSNRIEILRKVYSNTLSTINTNGITPKTKAYVKEGELELPELFDTVKCLDQTVEVDYYIPGCPPTAERILQAVDLIVNHELPPKGSVLAPMKSVCDECPKQKSDKKISRIHRVYEKTPDPDKCLLEQGIICMGPATRGGCGAKCLQVDMPCTGCGGPCPNTPDQGAAMISALASILGLEEEAEKYSDEDIEALMDQIKDPIGTFYMYGLPASLLRRKVMKK